MSDLLTEKELKRKTAKEPPKRWRNQWRVYGRVYCETVRAFVGPGKIWSPDLEPTKDIAETHAAEAMAHNEREHPGAVAYLGAFPVE